ncbi:unnamed protein product [Hyaloperonospora brassicae]|uniref:Uncharacterized protein n=1 Tax=Hyaloperonospora brassicae TaxID=162125 RepID=A0AAV0TWB7_HYABA|nr:unnamed protein product [Hyaloperonospora brassicae]
MNDRRNDPMANTQPALWYYCNLRDTSETSCVVPMAQEHRRAARGDTTALVERPPRSVAFTGETDDELSVPRSTFVLAADFAATSDGTIAKVGRGVSREKDTASERVATEPVAPAVVEGGGSFALETEAVYSMEKSVVRVVAAEEEGGGGGGQVEATAVEVEQDAVEVVAVITDTVVDVVVAEAVETVAKSRESYSSAGRDDAGTDATTCAATVAKTASDVVGALGSSLTPDVSTAAKRTTGDACTTASQPKSSNVSAQEAVGSTCAAEVDEDLESEIDETMVIDRDVAATEAAAAPDAQTSSLSFLPEQIRNNSYAVSSVAVAVAAAVAATLLARR